MQKKKTVITGMGVVSPLGIGKDAFWEGIFSGKSAFRDITLFDTSDLKVKIAGEISGFEPKEIIGEKGLMDLDRATLLLLCAAKLALDDSGLEITESNTNRSGVCTGTTFGSLYSISKFNQESYKEGPRYVNPSIFPSTVGNSPGSRVSIRYKIKGFSTSIATGMCSALDALDYSRDFINLDKADTILACSVEDLSIQTFLGFYKLQYLAGLKEGSQAASAPFDKNRNGIVFSEAAVTLVLQDEQTAKKTNKKVYARVLGIGSCFDPARFYRYNPKGEGMKRAMKLALDDAELKPQDIDCIFANANSTKAADLIETQSIKEIFGQEAYKVPITAIKSMLGEAYSASGSLAVAAAIAAIEKSLIPATINYKEKDPRCDLDYVVDEPRIKELNKVIINTFGPNGFNTSVILGKAS